MVDNGVAMFGITKEPTHDEVNISPLTLVQSEVGSEEAGSSTFNHYGNSIYDASIFDCPIASVKTEVLDDAPFSEDEVSDGPGSSSYATASVKQELDIGPTELQPTDMQFMLQPCKPEPDYHNLLPIIEDSSQGHELLVLKGEQFSQQPDNNLLLQDSPGSLPQGMCGPTSEDNTERMKTVAQHNHTYAPNRMNPNTIEWLALTSRAARTELQKSTDLYDITFAESNSRGGNSCDVQTENLESRYCLKVFFLKSNFLSHVGVHKNKHSLQNSAQLSEKKLAKIDSTYECYYCRKMFSQISKLNLHIHEHTCVKLDCKSCGKRFAHSSTLTNDMRGHSGDKVCKYCEKKFADKSNCIRHMRLHTGETPFECNSCGKKFSDPSALTSHSRVHTAEKPFECKLCFKRFKTNGTLTMHMQVHTGEKPFECHICGMRFAQKPHLTMHMRRHTGEKPFECNSCDKRFTNNGSLSLHMRVHTRETL